jgi:hypothetical protein
MFVFASGMSAAACAADAAREALREARQKFSNGSAPKLAIVFASVSYDDVDDVAAIIRAELGDVPIVGGTSGGCVIGPERIAHRGVSIVLLGGDDIEVAYRSSECATPQCIEAVPAAEQIARAADDAASRGLTHFACLVFAPGIFVDGEALVTAVRKGAGARAQLAGGLTGDDLTMDRPKIYADGELRSDRVVVAGLFTTRAIGIAARHGWQAVGPVRTVTRTDGIWLCELDGKPALDVWLGDARSAGANPPSDPKDLALFLANHYEIGITGSSTSRPPSQSHFGEGGDTRELVARAPFAIRADGALQLSAAIAEGTHVCVLHATKNDLLRASTEAAAAAVLRAGQPVAGALVLACSGRLAALGDGFGEEPARIRERVAAPIGGACVFGEIARNVRDTDAFFNTTAVVVAFSAD